MAVRGGDKLKRKLREISERLRENPLRVGFLKGATYPDGTSVPMVAYMNEYGRIVRSDEGDYYQLPRPFFRIMVAKNKKDWPEDLKKLILRSDYDSDRCLNLMGFRIKGQLQESITALVSPPLAESTIARKGFSKPLIDTSHMLNSVDFEVQS